MRAAELSRTTAETDVRLRLELDGTGLSQIATGCGFLDHMLTLFARHGRFDLSVQCTGDTNVDDPHSTNPIIWDCIFYVFTDKLFANLLMFHLLFLAAQFLSIKIVSQKAEKCNHIPRLFQITSHFSLILFLDMF